MGRTFAFLALACCLVASLLAAPLADVERTSNAGNEVVDLRLRRFKKVPSRMTSSISPPLKEINSRRNEKETEKSDESNLLGGLIGTVLALPSSIVTSIKGLFSGMMANFLGGTNTDKDNVAS